MTLTDPTTTSLLHDWAVFIGLGVTSTMVTFGCILILMWGFRALNVIRMKDYRKRMAELLENVYYANYADNKELAGVAEKLLYEIDSKRASQLTQAVDAK